MREYNVLLETLSRTEGAPAPPSCRWPGGGCPPSVSSQFLIGTPLWGAHGGASDNASLLVSSCDVGHVPTQTRMPPQPVVLPSGSQQSGRWGAGSLGSAWGVPGGGSRRLLGTEIQENVISPFDMSRVKEDVLHSKHAELKDRLRGINQGYDRLRKVSHRGYGAEAGEHPALGLHSCASHAIPWRGPGPPWRAAVCSAPTPGPVLEPVFRSSLCQAALSL